MATQNHSKKKDMNLSLSHSVKWQKMVLWGQHSLSIWKQCSSVWY